MLLHLHVWAHVSDEAFTTKINRKVMSVMNFVVLIGGRLHTPFIIDQAAVPSV